MSVWFGQALLLALVLSVAVAAAALARDKIAFSSTRGGTPNADVYVMNADGSGQLQPTNSPSADVDPTWSPDGSRLVFTRIGFTSSKVDLAHIWVMNDDGSGQTQLTKAPEPDSFPAWSPDGTQIAFTRGGVKTPEKSEVFVMNADGTHVRRLTNSPGFDGFPSWSPDGTKIAFTSDRDGNPEIYTMNADGSGQTRRWIPSLLGLFAAPEGLAAHVLVDFGVTREDVLAELPGPCEARRYECLGVMPRLRQSPEHARRVAGRLGHQVAGTEHLLAGILAVPDALAVEILERRGVGADAARAAIAERLDVDSEQLVVAHRRRRRPLARTHATT